MASGLNTNRMPITVRLDQFEGPLDLLLYLIQSHEMDISKIAISKITDQYLAYVRLMQELNFDIASEFLVMAATLLLWKSKSLLPQDPALAAAQAGADAEPSQEDLILQLLQHQRFRAAGEDLAQLPRLGEDTFTRPIKKAPVEKVWKDLDITDLGMTFQDVLIRSRKRTTVLKKETVSLSTKLGDFKKRLVLGKLTAMNELLSQDPSRAEVVVTFLASLELSRLKKMRLHQQEVYESIYVELLENLDSFDPSLASGFDHLEERATASPGLENAVEQAATPPTELRTDAASAVADPLGIAGSDHGIEDGRITSAAANADGSFVTTEINTDAGLDRTFNGRTSND
ncbi:MAG: segregation/condensation protein A [Bdellovibrionales bacterium]|nr:segregation/condensation protein A [Bdellovibrionales bacterium]